MIAPIEGRFLEENEEEELKEIVGGYLSEIYPLNEGGEAIKWRVYEEYKKRLREICSCSEEIYRLAVRDLVDQLNI